MAPKCAIAACAVYLLASGFFGCGADDPVPSASDPLRLIDERAGTYRGAGIGQSRNELVRHLGKPPAEPQNEAGRMAPLSLRPDDLAALPGALPPQEVSTHDRARIKAVRYKNVSFLVAPDVGTYTVMVADPDARTSRGVRIGRPLASARDVYPDLSCGRKNVETEYRQFAYCTGEVATRRYIWFGGDPIRSIAITVRPLTGRDPFR